MYRDKCCLCNTYRNKKKGIMICLYRFPRENSFVYEKWINLCKITEEIERKYSPKVCNNCFTENDFHPSAGNSERRKLKADSVPKEQQVHQRKRSYYAEDEGTVAEDSKLQILSAETVKPKIEFQNYASKCIVIHNTLTSYHQVLKYLKEEISSTNTVHITHNVLSEIIEKLKHSRKETNDLKARIKYRDIQIRCIRDKIKRKITAEQYHLIEDHLNNIPDLLIERMKKIEKKGRKNINEDFSEELKKFIVTLHYKSPSAYRYVREVFNGALPHFSTIRRWNSSVNAGPGHVIEEYELMMKKCANKKQAACLSLDDIQT